MKENNWLGTGKAVEFQVDVDEESLAGVLSLTDPNYDNLGNSLNYFLRSESNDKPNQGYENSVVSAGLETSFWTVQRSNCIYWYKFYLWRS